MTERDAEKIVKEFGGIVADIPKGLLAQEVRDLPYSPGTIKHAFFVYIEALVDDGNLSEELFTALKTTYSAIDTKFIENANEVNNAYITFRSSGGDTLLAAQAIIDKRGGLTAFMPSTQAMGELHNFVVDCEGGWRR